MPLINQDIENLMHGKSNTKEIVHDAMYVLMRDLHLSYREIKRMPLEDILKLLDRWAKEQKKIKEDMKKNSNNKSTF
jgi:hypothetical protein